MNLYSEGHKNVLSAFLKYHVKFLILGGQASIYYGVNRNTGDLDILIEPSRVNGEKVVEALKSIKLEVPEFSPEEFESKLVLSFGFEPDAVDILNYAPGLQFPEAYENAIEVDADGLKVKLINIYDLIRNKEQLQRSGEKAYLDKYDAEVLKKILKRNSS